MPSSSHSSPVVEARDFDSHRKEPHGNESAATRDDGDDNDEDDDSSVGFLDDNHSLLDGVASGILERDRRAMGREVRRWISYASAIFSCLGAGSLTAFSLYGPLLQSRLHYNQYQVNAISISAELAQYLPVPFFGYLVDRYSPRPVSLIAAVLFASGYFVAAFSYRSGPSAEGGWPFWTMILAFVGIGSGTCSMYLAAVAACAKNTGESKYKGVALAMPIASFGLSGVWQSQVGSRLLYEVKPDGRKGEVDVFLYFVFLGTTLLVMGLIGAVAQVVVDQDEALENLERSGMLEDSPLLRRDVIYDASHRNYGTQPSDDPEQQQHEQDLSASMLKAREEDRQRKNALLNGETRRFLADHTMWFLALGFFLLSGPVETYINNNGSMILSLYPPGTSIPESNARDWHVSILAIASTFARFAAGIVSDLFSPSASPASHYRATATTPSSSLVLDPALRPKKGFSVSRLTLLVGTGLLLACALLFQVTAVPYRPEAFPLVTSLVGLANGAAFALTPLLISSVWGVENFGTNWGIVATTPALGATIWSAVYSVGYQRGVREGVADAMCYGAGCWTGAVGGMAAASFTAALGWIWVGWGRNGWWSRGVVV